MSSLSERKIVSPYSLFKTYHRKEVEKNNPGISPRNISKILNEMWLCASEDEKIFFIRRSNMFNSDSSMIIEDESKKRKRVTSEYMLFCEDKISEVREDNYEEILRDMWLRASDEEKMYYREKNREESLYI